MKKIVALLLCIILLGGLYYCKTVKDDKVSSIDTYFLSVLNGYTDIESEDIEQSVLDWGKRYQDNNFISDDSVFCVLEDVAEFKSVLSELKNRDEYYKDNPYAGFSIDSSYQIKNKNITQEMFDRYELNYSDSSINDSRIFERNNKYYIYYKDIDRRAEFDEIIYNNFHSYILKEDLIEFGDKETYSQRQAQNRFQAIGYEENGNDIVYKYFDSAENKTIDIRVTFNTLFVSRVQMRG